MADWNACGVPIAVGILMTGAKLSLTVIVIVKGTEVFPHPSVAMKVNTLVYLSAHAPGVVISIALMTVTVFPGQLSVATGGMGSTTALLQAYDLSSEPAAGTQVGATLSFTVRVTVNGAEVLPQPSDAV